MEMKALEPIFKKLGCLFLCLILTSPSQVKGGPLHNAAMTGDAAKVEQLLQEGADVNAIEAMGAPLHIAILAGHSSLIELLLARGADVDAVGPFGTPLYQAVFKDDAEIVRLLLQNGAEPSGGATDKKISDQTENPTPLHEAARKGSVEIVDLLLESGADPNATTFEGQTPLHNAAKTGRLEIVQLLIAHAGDVNALDAQGFPPIHLARRNKHEAVAKLLIEQGASAPTVIPISDRLQSADLAKGKKKAESCLLCHLMVEGENIRGPTLWNIVGRPKASLDNFTYSPAMAAEEGSWDYESLNTYIAYPAATVPGTAMEYSGIGDPQDRADLILYLRSLSANPLPLP